MDHKSLATAVYLLRSCFEIVVSFLRVSILKKIANLYTQTARQNFQISKESTLLQSTSCTPTSHSTGVAKLGNEAKHWGYSHRIIFGRKMP